MIYIFDSSHETQINSRFYSYLRKFIIQYHIDVIAEEADYNHSFNGIPTIAYQNRLKFDLKYINIENPNYQADTSSMIDKAFPTLESFQKAHFLLIKKNFNKRERYWFKKILPYKNKNILLICGAAHFKSFTKKLEQFKIPFKRLDSFMIINEKLVKNKFFKSYLNYKI